MNTRTPTGPAFILVTLSLFAACRHGNMDRPETLSPGGRDDSTEALDDAPPQQTADEPPAETAPQLAFVPGPGGVPLPADHTERPDMVPGGGKMFMFEVPRSRDAVSDELRANLAADGWTIDSEEVSPRHNALRLKVSKAGDTIDLRVAGDDTAAGIIITLK